MVPPRRSSSRFRRTSQVTCLLVAGIGAVALLILGLSLDPPVSVLSDLLRGDRGPLDIRTVWLSGAVAAGAALLTASGLVVPRKGVSPFWGRALDIAESVVLLSLVPLCLAALDVYSAMRGMTSG
jgi:hypothetical protein